MRRSGYGARDPELPHRERLLGDAKADDQWGGDKATMPGGGERRRPWQEAAAIPRWAGWFALCCHPHRLGVRHGSAADVEERADAELEEQQRAQG
jgi:hypothetical protein